MKIASALFLSLVCAAAMPAPLDDPALAKFVDRGVGFVLIENLPVTAGSLDVLTPMGQPDWARVRLDDGPWSDPIPFNALNGQSTALTITFTFCVSYPIYTPYSSCVPMTEPVQHTITVGEPDDNQSLEQDLQELKDKVAAFGGVLVQCH